MANKRSPYCTGLPFSTYALTTSPSYSDVISFISFIASMMQSTWSFFTRWPISTNDGGAGLRAPVEGADDRRLHHRQLDATRRRRPPARRPRRPGPGPPAAPPRQRRRRRRRRGDRHHLHGRGVEGRRGARLAHAQLQPVPLQLEFREVVLPHELENLLDIRKVQSSSQLLSSLSFQPSSRPRNLSRSPARRLQSARRRRPGTYAPGSIVKTMPGSTTVVGEPG